MIPAVVPPLTGLSVLVTRPEAQAASLVERITAAGGDAYRFPVIEIEPIAASLEVRAAAPYDCTIFLSVNAVRHGWQYFGAELRGKVAAIGRATTDALKASGGRVDIEPAAGFDSEALLRELENQLAAEHRVLLVKGAGGRELLHESLSARGVRVDVLEVYRRVRPQVDDAGRQELENYWSEQSMGIVTLTSGEILTNLDAMLSERGKQLLRVTPFITVSERIERMAREMGLQGESLVARADEDALLGALALWHTRARDIGQQAMPAVQGSNL